MKPVLGMISALLLGSLCWAQPDRIAASIDSARSTRLTGTVHSAARKEFDQGEVPATLTLPYVTIALQPSAAQRAELQQLLQQQQDHASLNYHKWLTPEQYADRFGLSSSDIHKLTFWLQTQGFTIVQTARGRNWIAFSGPAAFVENTFHTQIHYFNVQGQQHFANATDISIPQALSGIVAGISGLNDFAPKPMGIRTRPVTDFFPLVLQSDYTLGSGHFLAPDDIATIYDLTPLYNASIDGTGMKIVVVGQVDISSSLTDIDNFRSVFGLQKNDPQQTIVTGSPNPGTDSGDLLESKLDVEWAGAVARNATVLFITAATTANGVFAAAQYAIDQNLAPVISMSYGACESLNASFLPANEDVMKQANTEGITFVTSSGDTGAAGCDDPNATVAVQGLAVNYPASSPEATGVGGTEFSADSSNPALYWNTNNSATGASAISYIPETSWNDSALRGSLAGSGGGASSCQSNGCESGFPKPTWQSGTGVPGDKVRDVPDVSLTGSADHDGYIICASGSCASGVGVNPTIVGGTSATAPVFAGIVTLLNQSVGGKGLGNINSTLYQLAQTPSNGVFHDITTGSNIVTCTPGTPISDPVALRCPSTGTFGYKATVGYDLVTGLGSVDANNLVCQWSGKACSSTALTIIPNQFNVPGSVNSVTLTATLSAVQGSGTPTGTVTFMNGIGKGATQIGSATLNSGTATITYDPSALKVGLYPFTASYGGDSTFTASNSPAENLTVGIPTTSTLSIAPASVMVGASASVTFTTTVTPQSGSGTATGTVTFSNGSTNLGSATLSGGTASFIYNPASLAGGTYAITAKYSGDSTFVTSTSAAQNLNVSDFAIAANPTTLVVTAPGQSAATAISISNLGGFSGSLSFSCSGLPSGASCTFASLSANSETLTVTTTGSSAKLHRNLGNKFLYAFALPGLMGILVLPASRRKRAYVPKKWMIVVALLGVSTLSISSCGGGSSSTPPPVSGTPTGNSTVTITATSSGAAAITHKITITLTVE
jgi:hypothetical protein